MSIKIQDRIRFEDYYIEDEKGNDVTLMHRTCDCFLLIANQLSMESIVSAIELHEQQGCITEEEESS